MNAHARTFTSALAVREHVPLLIGLMGPSGGGKTFSALRLATGIQQITGGDIFGIDTEANRMKHYADHFKFRHVPFKAPFGSLDYLAALQYCADEKAGVVIVDSMSHEHEGEGGMLSYQEAELDRMAGDDYRKRESMKMLAWGKPKAARRQLINGLLQMNTNFIFCFRAKNTVKPVKVNGKTEVVPQGFMPIAGDEFVFEMTLNALLLPGAEGVPTWRSESVGERMMIKLPEQFRRLADNPRPLDETMGKALATWARGGAVAKREDAPAAAGSQGRTFEADAPDRSSDTFPGDQPSTTREASGDNPGAGGGLTLAQRVEQFDRRLADAPTAIKAASIWRAAQQLRDDLDRADPEELAAMELRFSERFAVLEDAERAGAR